MDREMELLDSARYHEQISCLKDEHRAELARIRSVSKQKYMHCYHKLQIAQRYLRVARGLLISLLRGSEVVWMGEVSGWEIPIIPVTYKKIGAIIGLSSVRTRDLYGMVVVAHAHGRDLV